MWKWQMQDRMFYYPNIVFPLRFVNWLKRFDIFSEQMFFIAII